MPFFDSWKQTKNIWSPPHPKKIIKLALYGYNLSNWAYLSSLVKIKLAELDTFPRGWVGLRGMAIYLPDTSGKVHLGLISDSSAKGKQ